MGGADGWLQHALSRRPGVTAGSMNHLFQLFYAVDHVRGTIHELVRDVLLVSLTESGT